MMEMRPTIRTEDGYLFRFVVDSQMAAFRVMDPQLVSEHDDLAATFVNQAALALGVDPEPADYADFMAALKRAVGG